MHSMNRLYRFILLCIISTSLYGFDQNIDDDIPSQLLPEISVLQIGNYWDIIISIFVIFLITLVLYFLIKIILRKNINIIAISSFKQFLLDIHNAKLNIGESSSKYFCYDICNALKSYLQREYNLPLTCRTTEEFLDIFEKISQFSFDKISTLSDILQYSDMAKFAEKSLTIDMQKNLFVKTCYFARIVRIKFYENNKIK